MRDAAGRGEMDQVPCASTARPDPASGRAGAEHAVLLLRPALRAQGLSLGLVRVDDPEARPAGPGEWASAAAMPPPRRRDFLAGRCAARRALAEAGHSAGEIPRSGRRPLFPAGFEGSISHSGGLAVALAARVPALGCDLELRGLPPESAHIVLGPDERGPVDDAPDRAVAARLLLRAFSAKEAAFKAFGALLDSEAPATLLGIGTRPVPGGFRAWPRGLPGHVIDVRVRPAGPGVFSWAVAPVV
ncbi:4'-phosphopantetheinyl transferase superfamily protein [Streptomyces sp. BPTC-684]|uniref:4'-phosphopantetheinyl transferase superfamily protein n=1 Tax=Streptomyces sp. BPTC-684 TaxID=3043734 RepID=UPI0024B065D3|nr:4'-phosphopantetheinyl transferase superfamily protein [Streptomyces sp. BPTC-684]WHM40350.1 4'-phosphopantetheinyl transferase superfamily protein [Streptomyces sp. BPTC-684]